MQAIQTVASMHVQGRAQLEQEIGAPQMTPQDKIKVCIESSFNNAKSQIDQMRNEVEVHRLQLVQERQAIDADKAEFIFARQ